MSERPPHSSKPEPVDRPWPARALLACAVLLHLGLTYHFAPPAVMLEDNPVNAIDYSLHVYQVDRARKAFEGWGEFWSYDPQVLAGQPAGALEDLTSRGMELFVIGLTSLGVAQGLAFNLFILLIHLLVPLCAWLTARLLGLDRWQRATAVLLWVLLWYFDSFFRWTWYCGMISWAGASCMAPVLVALVYNLVERERPWLWLVAAPLAALLVTVHPFAAFAAAPPCAVIYLRRVRILAPKHHLGLALTVGLVVASQVPWLITAGRFAHYLTELKSFLMPPLYGVLADYLDLLRDPWDSGAAPVRTLFRFLALAAGLVGLWRWRRAQDPRWVPLALMGLGLLLVAHAGRLLPFLGKTQPYRQIIPAVLILAMPAAAALARSFQDLKVRRLTPGARVLLLLALVLLAPRVVRTVMVTIPGLIPERPRLVPGQGPVGPKIEPLTGNHAVPFPALRHYGTPPHYQKIRDWLVKHHAGRGRVLTQDWIMSEYLAWSTDLPLVGGLEQRALQHADAHLFQHYPMGKAPRDWTRAYLERYAVGFLVVKAPMPDLEWQKENLEFVVLIDGHRIYRSRIQPGYFLRGAGKVASQALNSVKIRDASGPEVVLRFHWMETLRCRPGCAVERFAVDGDRVGFIRVKDPPAAFEIYNSYTWPEG